MKGDSGQSPGQVPAITFAVLNIEDGLITDAADLSQSIGRHPQRHPPPRHLLSDALIDPVSISIRRREGREWGGGRCWHRPAQPPSPARESLAFRRAAFHDARFSCRPFIATITGRLRKMQRGETRE